MHNTRSSVVESPNTAIPRMADPRLTEPQSDRALVECLLAAGIAEQHQMNRPAA